MADNLHALVWIISTFLSVHIMGSCDTTIHMTHATLYVGAGHNFTLVCRVVCPPLNYKLQWVHREYVPVDDGRVLSSETMASETHLYNLTVVRAGDEHSGDYHCRTKPTLALGNTISINVTDINVTVSSERLDMYVGETMLLNCSAVPKKRFDKPISVRWALGGCDGNSTVSENGSFLLTANSTQDSGQYHCCATAPTNEPLHRSRSVNVTVRGPTEMQPPLLFPYLFIKAGFSAAVVTVLMICKWHS